MSNQGKLSSLLKAVPKSQQDKVQLETSSNDDCASKYRTRIFDQPSQQSYSTLAVALFLCIAIVRRQKVTRLCKNKCQDVGLLDQTQCRLCPEVQG